MHRRNLFIVHLVLAAWLGLAVGAPALACIWDRDTLLDEQRGLPGVAEILAGKWERHSKFFYEHRAEQAAALLEREPSNLAAYDDLAVAYEKLGDQDRAIEVMLRKDKVKPGEYTTEANLGTFYLHKGDLENGIAHIRKALAINPDAHFGREKYQLMAAEYLRDAKANPAALKSGSFAMSLLFRVPEERDSAGSVKYYEALTAFRDRLYHYHSDERFAATIDHAILGIVGMIRFGTGTSPYLFDALGDLLAARGDRHLASRAYRRAVELGHPTPELIAHAREMVEGAVENNSELSETLIARERAEADAWVAAFQQFEDGFVRANGREPGEADYASFYREHGAPRATYSRFEVVTHSLAFAAFFWLCIAAVVAVGVSAIRRRRRARYTLGKTNGVLPPAGVTDSIGTP
jgi:tetratricopeptide (TPR) repeat protein